ncbi:MAG: hypothetical protein HYS20_13065 [Rhodocyclales bacterium]|nr:hypothetical protein [Rhodocyclales bacterium]
MPALSPASALRNTLNLVLLLIASTASAAQQAAPVAETLHYDGGRLALTRGGGDCAITLHGDINPNAVRQLTVALSELDKSECARKSLSLNASQGTVNAAITVGAMLRNRGYDTRIEDGSLCLTPCALVFMSGRERHLSGGAYPARIGFQQLPPDRDFGAHQCQTEPTRNQSLTLSRYLRAMLPSSTATAILNKIGAADCNKIQFVGTHEALTLGLATSYNTR